MLLIKGNLKLRLHLQTLLNRAIAKTNLLINWYRKYSDKDSDKDLDKDYTQELNSNLDKYSGKDADYELMK